LAGPYALQAGIAAVHATAPTFAQTDWRAVVALYDQLATVSPSAVVQLNRAVAVALADGPAAGLDLVDQLADGGELDDYHLLHTTRADLLRRLGRRDEARAAYLRAIDLVGNGAERDFLLGRVADLGHD
jgi:RNA polymerase sigma-70 factor, ECF subfamily